jgi:hypothetical protein
MCADDECVSRAYLVDLGPVLVGTVEHPGVQLVARAVIAVVAERAFLGLVEPSRVSVGRDRDVADHPARSCGHCSVLLAAFAVSVRQSYPGRAVPGMADAVVVG